MGKGTGKVRRASMKKIKCIDAILATTETLDENEASYISDILRSICKYSKNKQLKNKPSGQVPVKLKKWQKMT